MFINKPSTDYKQEAFKDFENHWPHLYSAKEFYSIENAGPELHPYYAYFFSIPYGTEKHPFHIVDNSPWPILVATSLFTIISHCVLFLHDLHIVNPLIPTVFITKLALVTFFFALGNWFYDIIV